MILKQNAIETLSAQGLSPRVDETTKEFLCRLFHWVFEQEDIVSKIPWWVPVSIVKLALFKAVGCNQYE